MDKQREISTLWGQLLESVNYETLIPKFPKRATECVQELANIAKADNNYDTLWNRAQERLPDDDSPEAVFFMTLSIAATTEGEERNAWILGCMSLLAILLNAQRRCRVCGCTDYNACYGGCSWVSPDLCSECFGRGDAE